MHDVNEYWLIGIAFLGGMLATWHTRNEYKNGPKTSNKSPEAKQQLGVKPPLTTQQPLAVTGDLGAQVHQLLAGGNKIEAIKLVRTATGLGLAEAKHLIEESERTGQPINIQPKASSTAVPADHPLSNEVMTYIRNGKKIEAIKQLREETGLGLAEAKELIERGG